MNPLQTAAVSYPEPVSLVSDALLKPVFNSGKSIEIEHVSVSFKTDKGIYTAVKDISLSIRKGEIVSLIGHSGCGSQRCWELSAEW